MREPDRSAGVVSVCALRVGSSLFGIETREIREVLGTTVIQPVPLAPSYIAGVIAYRGEVLTAVSLRALLGEQPSVGAGCVLVLDDEAVGECFALVVDTVGSVTTLHRDALEAVPGGLDARCSALFAGAYRTEAGLMVRLESRRIRPARLAESSLFAAARPDRRHQPAALGGTR